MTTPTTPPTPGPPKTPKRAVLIHRYFRPDTPPYAAMLAEIATALADDGFDVEVLTAQPSYGDSRAHDRAPASETVDGVDIIRFPLLNERKDQTLRRGVNLLAFSARVAWRVLRMPQPDVVMAATTPPMLVAMAARWAAARRGASFVYHNQDVYPEVLGEPSGRLRSSATGALRKLDSRTGTRAARVVVLSRDMTESWKSRGLPESGVAVINNFDSSPPEPEELSVSDHKAANVRRIVFAGNVGKFQQVPAIVAAVEEVVSATGRLNDVEFVVVGDGAELEAAKAQAQKVTRFVGRVSSGQAAAWVRSSDLAVVSLSPGLIRYVYPSKTFGYLAAGVPLLVCVEHDSELAQTVIDEGVGWVAAPGDAASLHAALEAFLGADDASIAHMGQQARALSARHDMPKVMSQWVELFREVAN